ncbi:MAG: TorF family putative porin [Pseudomonadota bacterium]
MSRLLCALAMLAAPAAWGQTSASVTFTSELSARGVTLSDGRATTQLGVAYDGEQGWYAGAVAAPQVRLGERDRDRATQIIAYGGYAQRLASGLSWEAGVSATTFHRASEYNYREIYLGLASDQLSGRLYLAPAYYGYGGRVAYAELNGVVPLPHRLKLSAHAGQLHLFSGSASDRVDLRLALGYDIGGANVQLAWLHGQQRAPRALALSASCSF